MENVKEFADMPAEFLKEGTLFMNRCTKPDKKEFIRISQAVGIGFLIMGVIGYVVKLVHIPVNNILVGGSSDATTPQPLILFPLHLRPRHRSVHHIILY
ncbi:unnamed protein product [Alternaria alternata]